MRNREELIKELEKLRWEQSRRIFLGHASGLIPKIADFIIEDRKHTEIKILCDIYPELNSGSGITIQEGSRKEWALHRKIELEKELGV